MFQTTKQIKPGIAIFFSEQADIQRLNNLLTENKYFSCSPIGDDKLLSLPVGGYAEGFGGLQFFCYTSASSFGSEASARLLPASPFCTNYDSVVWIKDADGNILWQNWHFNEDGTPKKKEENPQ